MLVFMLDEDISYPKNGHDAGLILACRRGATVEHFLKHEPKLLVYSIAEL